MAEYGTRIETADADDCLTRTDFNKREKVRGLGTTILRVACFVEEELTISLSFLLTFHRTSLGCVA